MAVASTHRVPLAGTVLEPSPPDNRVRAVLGMTGSVLGLDHAEAVARDEAETAGVVLHRARVERGSDGPGQPHTLGCGERGWSSEYGALPIYRRLILDIISAVS